MNINLLKGSFTYAAVTIFSRLATVLLIPVLTRILSPNEYGVLSMVLTIVTLVNLIITFEIAQAVTLYFTDRNRLDRDLYPSTAFLFSMTMYLVLLLAVGLFGGMVSKMLIKDGIGVTIIFYGALLLSVNGIFFFIQNQLRLEFQTQKFAVLTLGYVALTSLGGIGFAFLFKDRTEGVVVGQVVGAAIVDMIGILVLWKRFSTGFNFDKLKEMLRLSLPLVPSGLLLLGGQQVPKIILSKFCSLNDVGIFGLAAQIAGFSSLAVLGVQTAITPSILANHHEIETPSILGKLFEKFATVALLFCAFLSVFTNELVKVFSTSSYANAANFVPYLAFALVLNSLYVFFPGKIIKGKSASQLIASGGSFLVAVISGVILVKLDGIRGAALSALLAAASFFFIWCYLSQKLYMLPVNWFKLFKATALTVIICVISTLLIPSVFTFGIIVLKSVILILFTCSIAWDYLVEIWKRYIVKE